MEALISLWNWVMGLARDSSWQFFGIIITVAVSIGGLWWSRPRKSLTYHIVSRQRLLTQKEQNENRLILLFEDDPVPDATIVVVSVTNDGNTPIPLLDYERPVTVDVGQGSRILTADVIECEPADLKPVITWQDSELTLMPLLMNKKDSVTLKLLVAGFGSTTVSCRVAGVKRIRSANKPLVTAIVGGVALVLIASGAGLLVPSQDIDWERPHSIGGAILIGVGYALSFWFISRGRLPSVLKRTLARLW